MSVLKDIGLEEALSSLGLTFDQVKGIFKVELEKLKNQETVLRSQIDSAAKKINEQYLERQKISQEMEKEIIAVEDAKKGLLAIKKENSDALALIGREKRDIASLHEKLDIAKEQFRQERIVYLERLAKLESDEKSLAVKTKDVNDKDIALDNLKDELYLKKRDLDEALVKASEIMAEAVAEKNSLIAIKIGIDAETMLNHKRIEDISQREKAVHILITDSKDELTKLKEDFYQEKRNTEESLRARDVAIARKEKFIDATEKSIQAKLDEKVLDESRRKKK